MAQIILPGNANTSQVLTGSTFSAGPLTNAGGTMPNNGALNYTPGQSAQTVPLGFTTGGSVAAVSFDASKVLNDTTIAGKTGTMNNYSGVAVATGGTATDGAGGLWFNSSVAGYVTGSSSIVATDPDFVASNIRNGVNIFGVLGNYATKMAKFTGTGPSSYTRGKDFVVTGLTFTPEFVVAHYTGGLGVGSSPTASDNGSEFVCSSGVNANYLTARGKNRISNFYYWCDVTIVNPVYGGCTVSFWSGSDTSGPIYGGFMSSGTFTYWLMGN